MRVDYAARVMGMIGADLRRLVEGQFALELDGIHGAPHWARVRENGLRLAEATGANTDVVQLFALLHDACRLGDGHDPRHGARAAALARTLAGSAFSLPPADLELLVAACERHSEQVTTGDVTVVTCWDADRLDLGRVGIRPRPEFLCTDAARDPAVIAWALDRSLAR